MQWFIKEQVEEIASMNDLLTTVGRAQGDPLRAEEFLAREQVGDGGADASAPPPPAGSCEPRPPGPRAARGPATSPTSRR